LQSQKLSEDVRQSQQWERHALARWPGADAALHGGSWSELFVARAALPAAFPPAADRVSAVTAAARQLGGPAPARCAVEAVMCGVNVVATAARSSARVRASPEFAAFRADISWWLAERPDAVMAFARSVSEAAPAHSDSWRPGEFVEAAWRRDAVGALAALGLLSAAHPSVADRVRREALALQDSVRDPQATACRWRAPSGIVK
jgi:hypothetical protein